MLPAMTTTNLGLPKRAAVVYDILLDTGNDQELQELHMTTTKS